MKIRTFFDLERIRAKGISFLFPGKLKISVGMGSCGIAAGADAVYEKLSETMKTVVPEGILNKTGCLGFCGEEPFVNVSMPHKPLVIYHRLLERDVPELLEHVMRGEHYRQKVFCKMDILENFMLPKALRFGDGYPDFPSIHDTPFYSKQKRIVLRESGVIDPESIEEYIAVGGYASLLRVLENGSSEAVVKVIQNSGLRGRGGAGFSTGVKWDIAHKLTSDLKYIICNSDEGNPGAYMNRGEVESDPHMLIEGMIIGGFGIGATDGIVYVRTEYPLVVERLRQALEQARYYGFLGKNICNSSFSFDIHIICGAGSFVCGEETALIASVEGFPGRPRPRPPFPSENGLAGKPTVVNNVETLCNVPVIFAKGAKWYSSIGSESSKGTKVFSLVGDVKHTGLVEVPMGTTLKEIIYDIGGGGIDGRKIKAVQIGGPSGGCIPSHLFDLPVDYESLQGSGAIMGSGGMVVLDEQSCIVDVTKYFLAFTCGESCGKCIPCRRGLEHMLYILDAICDGRGSMEQLAELMEVAEIVRITSLCGMGQAAPNQVISTIRYFKDEYEVHIKERKCPAGVCKSLL